MGRSILANGFFFKLLVFSDKPTKVEMIKITNVAFTFGKMSYTCSGHLNCLCQTVGLPLYQQCLMRSLVHSLQLSTNMT